jgi:hypothetical protein
MKRLLHWLWYKTWTVWPEPWPANFPPGPLRFCFENVETAPPVLIWTTNGYVVSTRAKEGSPDIIVDAPGFVVAFGVVACPDEALLSAVYSRGENLLLGNCGMLVEGCDFARVKTFVEPRWRLLADRIEEFVERRDPGWAWDIKDRSANETGP